MGATREAVAEGETREAVATLAEAEGEVGVTKETVAEGGVGATKEVVAEGGAGDTPPPPPGRGRGPSCLASSPKSALSNLIMADLTPNFKFYVYGVDGRDKKDNLIDSRNHRYDLFNRGLYSKEGLLARLGESNKDIESLKRIVFFEGSSFFSSRKIPGLDKSDLPRVLVGSKESSGDEVPCSDNGDSLVISHYKCYIAPPTLAQVSQAAAAAAVSESKSQEPGDVRFAVDRRCSDCTKAFVDLEALLQHCTITGHGPEGAATEVTEAPTRETFLTYCNILLQRAMGERMARWGREYIDPKNFTEPQDKNGNDLGVRVYRAYSCEFGLHRSSLQGNLSLTLTVDLRAKILRKRTLLEQITEGRDPNSARYDDRQINQAKRTWESEVVIW